jgi:hypothetical protein
MGQESPLVMFFTVRFLRFLAGLDIRPSRNLNPPRHSGAIEALQTLPTQPINGIND